LAEVLKAAGRLVEAEVVYRQTAERFPDDVFARSGLAEVLKAADRLPEAEVVDRQATEWFPDRNDTDVEESASIGLPERNRPEDRIEWWPRRQKSRSARPTTCAPLFAEQWLCRVSLAKMPPSSLSPKRTGC